MAKILLLEDDLSLIQGLTYSFRKQGFDTDVARTIKEADSIWHDGKYDLLILDLTLPDGSGFEVCQKVRKVSKVPIIFLTASDEEVNIVMGLDIGGDDYITKPVKLSVLLSRIHAVLRRYNNNGNLNSELMANGIKVQMLQGQALKNNKPIELTLVEYRLLCFFMQNPNIVLSKEKILNKLWDGEENYVDDNTLNVYISRLRNKIEDTPSNPQMLLTIRGMGYKWSVKD